MRSLSSLKDVQKKKYQGYVWYSDQKEPKTLTGTSDFEFTVHEPFPFVVEALLFCNEDNTSVMVRHSGKYYITEYEFSNLPDGAILVPKSYLPHGLESKTKVCFQQLWLPEIDLNCENMEVLILKAVIFSGFDKQPNI